MTEEELKIIDLRNGQLHNAIETLRFEYLRKIEQLEQQKQKAISLIKDGRFVEALQLLEGDK